MFFDQDNYKHYPTSILKDPTIPTQIDGAQSTQLATTNSVGKVLVDGLSYTSATTDAYIKTLANSAQLVLEDIRAMSKKRNTATSVRGWE